MPALPEGWEFDYDRHRWFYRYKPTGETQFHFPREGDEFPEFVVPDAPMPDLAPEEKLESQQQIKRRVPTGSEKDDDSPLVSKMRATGGPMGSEMNFEGTNGKSKRKDTFDQDDGDDDEPGFYYQPESFMFLGPGAYNDVSPIEDERDQPEITTAREMAASTVSPTTGEVRKGAKVSPIHSEAATPVTAKTEPSGGASKPPTEQPRGAQHRSASSTDAAVISPLEESDRAPEIALLDSREMPHELPANIPLPAGVAEMAAEDTPRAPIETNPDPVEVGDNSVLAPIETMFAAQESTVAELAERISPTDRKPVDTTERDELQGTTMPDDALLKATFGTNSRHHQVSPMTSSATTAPVSPPIATPQSEPVLPVDTTTPSAPDTETEKTPTAPKPETTEASGRPKPDPEDISNAPGSENQQLPVTKTEIDAPTPAKPDSQGVPPTNIEPASIPRTDSPFKIKRKPTNPGARPIKQAAAPSPVATVKEEEEKKQEAPVAKPMEIPETETTEKEEENTTKTSEPEPTKEPEIEAIEATEAQTAATSDAPRSSEDAGPVADTLDEKAGDALNHAPSVLKPARGRPQLQANKTTDGQPSKTNPHIGPRPWQIREDTQKFLGPMPVMKRVSTAPPYPVTPMLNSAHLETPSEADRVKMPPLPAVLPSPTPQPILPRQQSFASSDVSAMSGRTDSSTSLANLQTPSPESEARRGSNGAPFFFVSTDGVQTPPSLTRGDPMAENQSSSGGRSRPRSVSLSGAMGPSQADANTANNPPVPRKIPLDGRDNTEQRRMSAIPAGAANLQWHPPGPNQFVNGLRSHTMPLGLSPDAVAQQSRSSAGPGSEHAIRPPYPEQDMHYYRQMPPSHGQNPSQPSMPANSNMGPDQAPRPRPSPAQPIQQQARGPMTNRSSRYLLPIQESSGEAERQLRSQTQPGPPYPLSNEPVNVNRPALAHRAITGPPDLQHQAPAQMAMPATATPPPPPQQQQQQQQQQGRPRGSTAESMARPPVMNLAPNQQGGGVEPVQRAMSMPPEKMAPGKEKGNWLSRLKKVTNKSSNILQKQPPANTQKVQQQQAPAAPPADMNILPNMGPQSQQPWPYAHSPFDMNLGKQPKQHIPVQSLDPQQAMMMMGGPGDQGGQPSTATPSVFGRSSMDNPRLASGPVQGPAPGVAPLGNPSMNEPQSNRSSPDNVAPYYQQQVPAIHLQRHASDASSLAPTISTVDISEAQAQPVLKGHLVSVRRPVNHKPMNQIAEQEPSEKQQQQWGRSSQDANAGPADRSGSPAVRRNPAQQSGAEAVVHPQAFASGDANGMAPDYLGSGPSGSVRDSAVSVLSEHEDPRASIVSNVSEGPNGDGFTHQMPGGGAAWERRRSVAGGL